MDHKRIFVWMVTFLCVANIRRVVGGFNLTIMHTNDVHGRIEETNKHSSRCRPETIAKGECYGGQERISTMVKEIRAKYPNSLLLDAGDQYQGSLFFYVYGGQVMADFMNLVGYDAMTLGNHEFDKGPKGLQPLLDNVTFPVVCCNIDTSKAPEMASVQKSTIIEKSGQKIGIVGYTTVTTPSISEPGPVTFRDEVAAVQAEVDKLTQKGINKIIGLGHSGYARDMEIAEKVRGLDIIVGGHTNTFLYTGEAPAHEEPLGLYPTIVNNVDGQKVLVVQDYAYGKYLGFLQVDFDDDGIVTAWNGNPILLDNSVAKDPEVTKLIKAYLPKIEQEKTKKVGHSVVHLEGDRTICRVRECNMGNFIADAIIHQNVRQTNNSNWNQVAIALFAGGGIRASMLKGDIMMTDVRDVMPFQNTIDLVEITGQTLWDTLEHSASDWVEKGSLYGGFLQVSGLRIIYDMKMPVGRRVVQALALCADCEIPEFQPINMTKTYKVMTTSFTVGGGDGFTMLSENLISHVIGDDDSSVIIEYVKNNSPIYAGLDKRIQFQQDVGIKKVKDCPDVASYATSSILLLVYPCFAFIRTFL